MTTNYRTDGVYLPPDDGRHFPIWSDVKKESFEEDFFVRHYAWINSGGVAHVAAYLRSLDVSGFDPGRYPPQTEMFHDIVAQSRPQECGWIDDILDGWGAHRPNVFILDSLVQRAVGVVKEWLQKPENQRAVPYRLEECGYTKVRNPDSPATGRWRIKGIKQNIYGNKELTAEKRLSEARSLKSDPD